VNREAFSHELEPLLIACVEDDCDELQSQRMDELLGEDTAALTAYIEMMSMHAILQWRFGSQPDDVSPSIALNAPTQVIVPPVIDAPPSFSFLDTTLPSAVGYFSSDWSVAYLVATVVFAVAALLGSVIYVSRNEHVADISPPMAAKHRPERLPPEHLPPKPLPKVERVGRIVAALDCKWTKDNAALLSDEVTLGQKFKLDSGLVEIVYKTGARVILQGPVTYQVESSASGYLSVGKLTARLEKRGEGREERGEGRVISKSPNAQIAAPSPLSSLPSPIFVVRTPTATVTDLGTEFGVEVSKEGNTTSHVFRGAVKLLVLAADAGKQGEAIVLHANETLQTEKSAAAGGPRIIVRRVTVDPRTFVRRVARPVKTLDLLDIVAQGYGTTHRRERGIDPTTGMEDPLYVPGERSSDGKYQPIAWHKLIDGVFSPCAAQGPVQLDSAGHTFSGFPNTVTDGLTWGSIWSRAAKPKSDEFAKNLRYWVYCVGQGEQFMPERGGLLGLQSSQGITFNLAAMRKMYPEVRPARFRATAGVADSQSVHEMLPDDGLSDIWVFVDGRVKFKQTQIRPKDGAFKVDVELGPNDRFLTLVSTDGGNKNDYDWVVFGEPVLDMVPAEEDSL
jgi:hypothetical protein